ncbi:hypothetical protein [Burkholderia contaminans]|uniref:hypothetical protein n=1 Tax=Burkholderia contaminans TaxID=488447 RepID=UPI00158A45B2|nr:hypothetical protein [Burkholderia contaminans]
MEKIIDGKVQRGDIVFGFVCLGDVLGMLPSMFHITPQSWMVPLAITFALIGGIFGMYITREEKIEPPNDIDINEILEKTFESKVHVFDSTMTKEERNKKFEELFGW